MNKRNQIFKVFSSLLETQGQATTKEVKDELRKKFPNENWKQHYVSNTIREIYNSNGVSNLNFRDNGVFREYYIISTATSGNTNAGVLKAATYSYTFNVPAIKGFPAAKVEVTGTRQEIENYGAAVNIPLRYSESKKEFQSIKDMHLNHIYNALKKDLANATNMDEFAQAFDSALADSFLEKYDALQFSNAAKREN